MKIQLLLHVLAISLLAACKTIQPAGASEDAVLIRIECRNDKILQTTILQRLRSCQAKDITANSNGDELDIQAEFPAGETPVYKVHDIERDLQQLVGVISVNVENSRTVIRQTSFSPSK